MNRVRSKKTKPAVPTRVTTLDCSGSSNLVGGKYDYATSELRIEFGSGAYIYSSVPPSVWDAMRAAPSKGAFLAKEIKPNYASRKVEE